MMNRIFALLSVVFVASCNLAPDFIMPETKIPDGYKEALKEGPVGNWKEAQSLEGEDRGQWWKIFNDRKLNELEEQAIAANNSLAAAAARVEQARAIIRANASTLLPTIDIGANASRAQPSSAALAAFGSNTGASLDPYNLYSAEGVATYEVDLFGRVRDNEKALKSDAQVQEAVYRSVLLALQADVAQHYYSLRAIDSERNLLRDTITIRKEALRIMKKKSDLGEAGEQDFRRSESELASAQADLLALDRQRAILENALAVLLGQLPSEFKFAESSLSGMPPRIPAGLPSTLLERRPDIAAAQAAMVAANSRIGVARTAHFPLLNLTASGGFQSTDLENLFSVSNNMWALGQLAGSALTMRVFDNGRTLAKIEAADYVYDESVAKYREQVLVAFRDVESNLAGQRLLAQQSAEHNKAAKAAQRTTELTQLRYDHGDTDYFEVVNAQRNSLMAERAAIQAVGQRFITTVSLIRALGGGW